MNMFSALSTRTAPAGSTSKNSYRPETPSILSAAHWIPCCCCCFLFFSLFLLFILFFFCSFFSSPPPLFLPFSSFFLFFFFFFFLPFHLLLRNSTMFPLALSDAAIVRIRVLLYAISLLSSAKVGLVADKLIVEISFIN